MLLRRTNLPVVHLLAPLRPCRLQRTSCLTCCLFRQLVHATKKRMRRTQEVNRQYLLTNLRTQWSYLFSAPAESKEVERPTLLFTRLHNHPRVLCRPTRNNPPRKEHNTYRTARAQYSAQLRCVADMWDTTHFEVFCRTGHNIITDFNFISPIFSGLRRPHL